MPKYVCIAAYVSIDELENRYRKASGPVERSHFQIIWLMDSAGWHSSQKLVIPDGIHLVFLSSYSPELQLYKRLWPLSNEAISNRHFKTLNCKKGKMGEVFFSPGR